MHGREWILWSWTLGPCPMVLGHCTWSQALGLACVAILEIFLIPGRASPYSLIVWPCRPVHA